eukprot:TRINITY_DN713_c0_g1_i10.p1 TRINITY_DN713_c0_g1~~TRINITY_DN713_c0_g1_i10.p1  ORF type:complete len:223 (-),score=22.10 TRINITY_DN713_c0_g1_i10:209-877(-)
MIDAVRTVFAGLTAISTSWCLAAAGGHILKQQGVKLPKIIGLASVFLAFVAYLGMFANYTYNPTNVRLLGAFTLFVASYVLHSTATGDYHPFADGCCILGIQNIAMLLWASLSFHGTSSAFDVKALGWTIYFIIIVASTLAGIAANRMIKSEKDFKSMLHDLWVIGVAFWMVSAFMSMCYALTRFRRGHVSSVIVYTFIWPLESLYVIGQTCRRTWDQGIHG